jgi:hypothetical protein
MLAGAGTRRRSYDLGCGFRRADVHGVAVIQMSSGAGIEIPSDPRQPVYAAVQAHQRVKNPSAGLKTVD